MLKKFFFILLLSSSFLHTKAEESLDDLLDTFEAMEHYDPSVISLENIVLLQSKVSSEAGSEELRRRLDDAFSYANLILQWEGHVEEYLRQRNTSTSKKIPKKFSFTLAKEVDTTEFLIPKIFIYALNTKRKKTIKYTVAMKSRTGRLVETRNSHVAVSNSEIDKAHVFRRPYNAVVCIRRYAIEGEFIEFLNQVCAVQDL